MTARTPWIERATSADHKAWMGTLPRHIRLTIGGRRLLLCHGSPRKINEFLWESTTPAPFIRKLLRDYDTDLVVCTHTGLHWTRLVEPGRDRDSISSIAHGCRRSAAWAETARRRSASARVGSVASMHRKNRLRLANSNSGTLNTGW